MKFFSDSNTECKSSFKTTTLWELNSKVLQLMKTSMGHCVETFEKKKNRISDINLDRFFSKQKTKAD